MVDSRVEASGPRQGHASAVPGAPWRIRAARAEDAAALAELGARTFAETFVGMSYYTQEIVDGYNAQTFTAPQMAAQIADPSIHYLLLEVDGVLAGYAKLIEREPEPCVAHVRGVYLQRIYLANAFQRRGLGTVLLDAAYDEARALGYTHVWLSVWEYNEPAVAFYRKLGFEHVGEWDWAFETAGVRYVDRDWIFLVAIPEQAGDVTRS